MRSALVSVLALAVCAFLTSASRANNNTADDSAESSDYVFVQGWAPCNKGTPLSACVPDPKSVTVYTPDGDEIDKQDLSQAQFGLCPLNTEANLVQLKNKTNPKITWWVRSRMLKLTYCDPQAGATVPDPAHAPHQTPIGMGSGGRCAQ